MSTNSQALSEQALAFRKASEEKCARHLKFKYQSQGGAFVAVSSAIIAWAAPTGSVVFPVVSLAAYAAIMSAYALYEHRSAAKALEDHAKRYGATASPEAKRLGQKILSSISAPTQG